ncbi:MAG: hypothetical protein U5K56_16970 [Halioglobus sp.]|nr:hypothetical protein [Halioglobus sp.]
MSSSENTQSDYVSKMLDAAQALDTQFVVRLMRLISTHCGAVSCAATIITIWRRSACTTKSARQDGAGRVAELAAKTV